MQNSAIKITSCCNYLVGDYATLIIRLHILSYFGQQARQVGERTFKNAKEVETSHIVPLFLKFKRTFVILHLTLPTPPKLLNSRKEWGRYVVFGVKGFNVW